MVPLLELSAIVFNRLHSNSSTTLSRVSDAMHLRVYLLQIFVVIFLQRCVALQIVTGINSLKYFVSISTGTTYTFTVQKVQVPGTL